jgi:hypothetical protein
MSWRHGKYRGEGLLGWYHQPIESSVQQTHVGAEGGYSISPRSLAQVDHPSGMCMRWWFNVLAKPHLAKQRIHSLTFSRHGTFQAKGSTNVMPSLPGPHIVIPLSIPSVITAYHLHPSSSLLACYNRLACSCLPSWFLQGNMSTAKLRD